MGGEVDLCRSILDAITRQSIDMNCRKTCLTDVVSKEYDAN